MWDEQDLLQSLQDTGEQVLLAYSLEPMFQVHPRTSVHPGMSPRRIRKVQRKLETAAASLRVVTERRVHASTLWSQAAIRCEVFSALSVVLGFDLTALVVDLFLD
jgi:hypothetical protein